MTYFDPLGLLQENSKLQNWYFWNTFSGDCELGQSKLNRWNYLVSFESAEKIKRA
jgi:hypothetical protein